MSDADLVVVGGGPSGLGAAHEAAARGAAVTIVEQLAGVGGLARTLAFAGCRFDIGPHRFFTRNAEIRRLFDEVVGADAVRVRRLTRILHDGHFFDYPLTIGNAIGGTGVGEAVALGASFAAARLAAMLGRGGGDNFEDWTVGRFGRRLYERFFRVYTEKVWGIPCHEISADWADQRIRGLRLGAVLRQALPGRRGETVKSLVQAFDYPRLGAGQTYENMAARAGQRGARLLSQTRVRRVHADGTRVRAVTVDDGAGEVDVEGRAFLVSAPLTDLVEMLRPVPPAEVLAAARALRYRDHLAVHLVAEGEPFPDQWIYVHDRRVRAARIANYRNFSVAMAGGGDVSPITVEYFAFPDDDLGRAPDEALLARARAELARLGLVDGDRLRRGFVVRSRGAYPMLEIGHRRHVAVIRAWLERFENLLPIGRAGMFKYNNQDHAMMTGILAARTALGVGRFDPWAVNVDAEYHEGGPAR